MSHAVLLSFIVSRPYDLGEIKETEGDGWFYVHDCLHLCSELIFGREMCFD